MNSDIHWMWPLHKKDYKCISYFRDNVGEENMKKASILMISLVLASTFVVVVSTLPDQAKAGTVYVGGVGPGNYTTIQSGVNAATAGDTVYVFSGTYNEFIFISKTISLVGENRDTTIIDGASAADVVYVSANWVNVTDFTLKRSGFNPTDAGLDLKSAQNCSVTGNIFTNNYHGVFVEFSKNNTIKDNYITSSQERSIYLYYADENTVENNNLSSNWNSGMHIIRSNWNSISNNSLYSNSGTGFYLQSSDNNTLIGNTLRNNGRSFNLYLSDNNNIVGNAISQNNDGILVGSSNGNKVFNNTISTSTNHGIRIVSSSGGNTVANNDFSSSAKYGVYIGSSSSNTVVNNTVFSSGWEGIRVDSSNSNAIARNTVYLNGKDGIMLWNCGDCSVVYNNATENVYGIRLIQSDNGTISNNEVSKNPKDGILLYNSSGNRVANNTVSLNSLVGINLVASDDNTVSNNTVSRSPVGIRLLSSERSTILGNVMVQDGILLLGDSVEYFNTHKIEPSNTVNGKPVYYRKDLSGGSIPSDSGQVILANCTNVAIENQSVSNGTVGIQLGFSSNNTIADSLASHNRWGLVLAYSDWNTLRRFNTSSNQIGIYVNFSSGNEIAEGEIYLNEKSGTFLNFSSNTTIHHNNFIMNLKQAIDNTAVNRWDDGYPSGGNYWSDYAGTDQFSGLNQDQPGSDGFGDTPYVIDADSQDAYPLMVPHGDSEPPRILEVLINGKPTQTYSLENIPELNLTAMADDQMTGRSKIQGANYTLGALNWSSSQLMNPEDGEFDSSVERVFSILPPQGEVGLYMYCVHSWDEKGNFNVTSTGCALLNISVPPSSPNMTDSVLSGSGFRDVVIFWNRSSDDGAGGNDVQRYDVYRTTSYSGPYELVANVTADGSLTYDWTCAGCGEGDPNNYFFYVEANDSALFSSAPNRVAKFTRPLAQGPNLVSFPLIQSNESIKTVLQTAEYDKAWYYDSSSREWKWHMTSKEYRRGLWNVDHTMGIWMNVTEDSNLTVAGVVPAQTVIRLVAGWNLVSFPSFNTTYTVADLKAEVGATRVEGYDLAPPYYLRVLGDAEVLQAGYGYWVKMEADTDWIVEVS